ncbi:MAG: dihydrofolate reductase [Deltaproteobacteria bacterium]|nr:MAG: dihydrofolate reductase [Deltaproteobacteria bacterium]TMQ09127.1 MAG: dihydrofolate reductase [Deltaproteobacteria bacterium]
MFDIVVAADLDWGIGKANGLPWPKLRGDLQHFKRITQAASEGQRNAVVMGRKTWESKEVAGRPLPSRLNVVVSRGELAVPAGVVVVHSLDEALSVGDAETIFVVGGAGLIRAAIERPDLRFVYLTRIDQRFDCDVRMPDLDARGFVRDAWDGEREAEDFEVRYRIERLRPPPGT